MVTAAAGIVLIAAPAKIPAAVDITIGPPAYLICYLLGAIELGMAYLSFYTVRLNDGDGQRLIVKSFIVVYLLTAVVEILALQQGVSGKVWGNVALRVVVTGAFYYFGLRRKPSEVRR